MISKGFEAMQIPSVRQDMEAQYSCPNYFSQPMSNLENQNEKFELGQESNEAKTDLISLTSKLSGLGQKAQQLEQLFRTPSLCPLGLTQEEQQQQARSSLNSVLNEVIFTSVSILAQCQILNNQQEPQILEDKAVAKEEEEEKVEIIEVGEDDILAEYVHFCKICGKGFRRDGNVRIHMRSHGNEYKTQEALKSNKPKPSKSQFSCPVEDCRRHRGHPSFKPLKTMVCLRNHYRRSHCAKMYICNNCGKEFSFVTDLKTHGNKCGHSSWRCSCNTTFSTKDKLFRHVAHFQEGHKPLLPSHSSSAPADPPTHQNPTNDAKSFSNSCAPDAANVAQEGLSNLAEGPNGCGSHEDLLMFDTPSVGMQQSEYMGQVNDFSFLDEYREENELYGSLLWSNADLQWS